MAATSDSEVLDRYFAAADDEGRARCAQELFRRHYSSVVTWCLRFAGDREEAYDLAQSVFAKAYRHLASFRGESKVSTWLYSIARHECLTMLRTRSRQAAAAAADVEELDDVPDDVEAGPDRRLEREASARIVKALLDETLDETEKKVFTMHFGDDVPLDAIDRLLGLTNRSGARAYLVSARRKLARAVRSWKARDRALDA